MDPNVALEEIRATIREEQALDGDWSADVARERLDRFAEVVGALDEWLSRGGFLPAAWQNRTKQQ